MPMSEFKQLEANLKKVDPTVTQARLNKDDDGPILQSSRNCKDLYDMFGNLQFTLHQTMVVIKPRGYLYAYEGQDDCYIGVQAIADALGEYRLGSIFLRNFYTGLDYEHNMLLIGLNKNSDDAEIHGASPNPYGNGGGGNNALLFVLLFLLLLIIIAVACYLRAKKIEKERTVVFEGPDAVASSSETGRRYKNGVEIKPSEAAKLDKEQKE